MPKLPRINARRIVSALEKAGFVRRRQTGSHVILRHPETKRMAVVPSHPGALGPSLISRILKQAGLTDQDLRRLLK